MTLIRQVRCTVVVLLLVLATSVCGSSGCDRDEIDQMAYCDAPCECPPGQLTVYCYEPGDPLCWCDCAWWIMGNCPDVEWRGYISPYPDGGTAEDGSVGDGGIEDAGP